MKKNLLRSLVLALGLVTCFSGVSFAARNDHPSKPQAQVFVNKTCKFEGHYKLHGDALQELQSLSDDYIKKASDELQICPIDLKVEKVFLNINKDGHGKFSLLVNIKTDSKSGLDIYSKTCFTFDISQEDDNTFTFDFVTKACNGQDDFKVAKEKINGKECLLLSDNVNSKIVFEKVR